MNSVDAIRRKRLIISRLLGILVELCMIALLLLFYFKMIDSWFLSVGVIFMIAITFTINAGVLETKDTTRWTSFNMLLSSLFFIAGVAIMVYGILTGNLIFF